MDELVEEQLRQLNLPHVSLIPLHDAESEELLSVKDGRSRGEYCWTLTPFTPQLVFDRDENVGRVTYIDADLFFFDSPLILLQEFEDSGKQVLITDHAYSPEYDQTATSGRFCVQFMTFMRTDGGRKVMRWWQERCLEWCFARAEDGKFGDQKYLDDWPERFAAEVHVLQQMEKTLAPWNASRFCAGPGKPPAPVFYHFHNLRIVRTNRVVLYCGYKIRGLCGPFYGRYIEALRQSASSMRARQIKIPTIPQRGGALQFLRALKLRMLGMTDSAAL